MSVHLYVGSLTRYLRGDWSTDLDEFAQATGTPLYRIGGLVPDSDDEAVASSVAGWTTAANAALAGKARGPVAWDERADAPYHCEQYGWSLFCCAEVAAYCLDHPQLPMPKDLQSEDYEAARKALEPDEYFQGPWKQLYLMVWLPVDFDELIEATLPGNPEREIYVGSAVRLKETLIALHQRYLGGGEDALRTGPSRAADHEYTATFEGHTRWAIEALFKCAEFSLQHRLPMIVDG